MEDDAFKRLQEQNIKVYSLEANPAKNNQTIRNDKAEISDQNRIEGKINDCSGNKNALEGIKQYIVFPAHLRLEAKRTSFQSKKLISGNLEITPQKQDKFPEHKSSNYEVSGRLEQNGNYLRLDYTNVDPSKKDFGTILLEYNGDGKLCGKFVSYGPISRTIVQGDYILDKE